MSRRTTLEILLKGKDRGASRALDQVEGRMQNVESSSDKLGGALQVAGAALASFATVETAKAVYQLAQLGAQSQRTTQAFENISGGTAQAEANLAAMERATRGAMSEMEMMANANKLLQMGLADSSEELATVTEMATRLGASMGMDAAQAMDDFAAMLANKSIPRLDQFGIASGRVRERWNELKKAVGDDEAFKLAVMEEGRAALERLGPAVDDNQLAFERLEATLQDIKVEIGERLTPVLADAAETAELLITWNERLNEAQEEHEEHVASTAITYEEYVDGVLDAAEAVNDLSSVHRAEARSALLSAESNAIVAENMGVLSRQAWAAQRGMSELDGVMDPLSAKLQNHTGILHTANENYVSHRQVVRTMGQRYQAMADAMGAASGVASGSFGPHKQATEALQEHARAAADLATSLKNATDQQVASKLMGMLDPKKMGAQAYSKAVTEIGTAYGIMDEKSIALASTLPDLAAAIESNKIPLEDVDEALGYLIEDAEDGTVKIHDLYRAFDDVPTNVANEMHNLRSPVQGLGSDASTASGQMLGFSDSLGATEQNLRSLVQNSPYRIEVIADGSSGDGGNGGDDDNGGGGPGGEEPGYQVGGMVSTSGWSWVGERGPELLRLPAGSRVYSNTQSRAMIARERGGEVMIQIGQVGPFAVNDQMDIEYVADRVSEVVGRRLNSELRSRGMM